MDFDIEGGGVKRFLANDMSDMFSMFKLRRDE